MKKLRFYTLLVVCVWANMCASQKGFKNTISEIFRYQKGDELKLKITCTPNDTCFVYKEIEKSIDSTIAAGMMASDTPSIFYSFKIKSVSNIGMSYKLNSNQMVEIWYENNRPFKWSNIKFKKIEKFHKKLWPQFIKAMIPYGLKHYDVYTINDRLIIMITIEKSNYSDAQFGPQKLQLKSGCRELLRVSNEYKNKGNNLKKFVVFVHEPHYCLNGQYKLINGLNSFISDNKDTKFRFLVEGYFTQSTKNIPLNPTLKVVKQNAKNNDYYPLIIYDLLNSYLIDGPYAYRLLFNHNLPAIAIDDPPSIKSTQPSPSRILYKNLNKMSKQIDEETKTYSKQTKNIINYYTYSLINYIQGDRSELKSYDAVEYYDSLASWASTLSKVFKELKCKGYMDIISQLENIQDHGERNRNIYALALRRDTVMVNNIKSHFVNNKTKSTVPIVFIGNFHTPGMINLLPKDMGYVVLEPRANISGIYSEEEFSFDKAVKSHTTYLRNLASSLKLKVCPSGQDLVQYPRILSKRLKRLKSIQTGFLTSSPLSDKTNEKINAAIRSNGYLCNKPYKFAKKKEKLPSKFAGAFASIRIPPNGPPSFRGGTESNDPILTIFALKEEDWQDEKKVWYLSNIEVCRVPEHSEGESYSCTFLQNNESRDMYCSIFEASTNTLYLFESTNILDKLDLFKDPFEKKKQEKKPDEKNKDVDVHIRTTIRSDYKKGELVNG